MFSPFDIVEPIEKSEIIRLFSEHESNRPVCLDPFALERVDDLKITNGVTFYKIKFTEPILTFLKMPHHDHGIDITPAYGKSVSGALELFYKKTDKFPNSECISKIRALEKYYFDDKKTSWEAGFILIGNNKDLAHPGAHYPTFDYENLFIFNGYHRLMAYFLKIKESGQFKPLHAYYAEDQSKGRKFTNRK